MVLLPLFLATLPALGFDEALSRVDGVVDLAARRSAVRTREEGVGQLGVFTSNPQITAQPQFRLDGTGQQSGAEGQVTVSQQLNLGGLAGARKDVARSETEVARHELSFESLQRRIAVGRAWLDAWAAQEASRVAAIEKARAAEVLARVERSAAGGALTRVEVSAVRALAAEAAAVQLEWEGRVVESGATLGQLLGIDEVVAVGATAPSFAEPSLASLDVRSLPAVKLALASLDAEQRRGDETRAQWATQLQLSVQGGHEAPQQWYGNVGVGVVLPILEHGARERSVHAATGQRLMGDAALAEHRARVLLKALTHEVQHTGETLQLLEMVRLPAAEDIATLEERRYLQGEATLMELVLYRRQALDAKLAVVLARARFLAVRHEAFELGATR